MQEILTGQHASKRVVPHSIRLITWNIERGEQFAGINTFINREGADVYALQEVDLNARRSSHAHVADQLARDAQLDFALGIAFEERTQGPGAYQGQAILSRVGIAKPRVIHFKEQSNFWKPRWWVPNTPPFQERTGGRIGLAAEIPFAAGFLVLYNLHLESRGNEDLRAAQLNEIVADANRYPDSTPIVIAGDLNTKHRSSPCIRMLNEAGFADVIGDPNRFTTNRGGPFARLIIDGALDWIWVRGSAKHSGGRIHMGIPHVSDHWPLSVRLDA